MSNPLKVSDLISLLNDQDQNAVVILSMDPEGNGFNQLTAYGTGNWDANKREIYEDEETADDFLMDQDEYNEMRKLPKCLLLWP